MSRTSPSPRPVPTRPRRRPARETWPRTATLAIVAAALAATAWCVVLLVRYPALGIADTVVIMLIGLPALAMGLLIGLRRPRNAVAPLLSLVGAVLIVVVGLGDEQTAVTVTHPETGAVSGWGAALAQGSWMLLYLPTALLLLVFPTGRFAGRASRRVGIALVAVAAVFLVIAGGPEEGFDPPLQDVPPPYHLPFGFHLVSAALPVVFLLLLIASALSMIVRHRRAADPVVRAQLRWFALGSLILPLTLLLCWLSYLLLGTADLVMLGLGLGAIAVPAATGIALLRHDLYDVDRAFSVAVTYSLVSGVLLTIFAVASAAGGAVLGRGSAIAATAACAVALAPLRRRLSEQVDRRLYPLRQGVRAALARLRTRIDDGLARPEDLVPTLRAALRDPGLRIGYVLPGRPGLVDERCAPLAVTGRELPVQLGGTHVGSLLPDATPAPRELLRETAAESALLVELIRSRLEITEALREVADSRARLLQAGYRERRRLERNLHDGAQQRLVSLGMAIRVAQRRLATGSTQDMDQIDGLLDQAVAELGTAVAELRTIAQGLRPADLDAGLGPAIRSLTMSMPIPVRLAVCEEQVPDEVATTAYYVASEALANVVKHSGAGNVDVSVARREGEVVVRIVDDGRGGATARPGSGLAGLVDRVAAAGGRFAVGPGDRAGTAVEAVLPCVP
ncbi:sensor histidine kinase [Pseudonocardia ailaonensis]